MFQNFFFFVFCETNERMKFRGEWWEKENHHFFNNNNEYAKTMFANFFFLHCPFLYFYFVSEFFFFKEMGNVAAVCVCLSMGVNQFVVEMNVQEKSLFKKKSQKKKCKVKKKFLFGTCLVKFSWIFLFFLYDDDDDDRGKLHFQ